MITAQAAGSRSDGRRPARTRPEPSRAPELAHLTLSELRDYRQQLAQEETRVSYWRRILQARLDSVIAPGDQAALDRLRGVLHNHAQGSRRLAMLPVAIPDGAPPLPDLTALWETTVTGDPGDGERLAGRLTEAEQELSSYRHCLHQRLDAATGELISRYREAPSLALCALPQQRTA